MSENIVISEGDAPVLTFQIRKRQSDSTLLPYSLVGATAIAFIAKVSPDDADGSAVFTYTMAATQIAIIADGSAVGAKYSEIAVTTSATNSATPRSLYYRIKVTKGTTVETVKKGFLRIENV